MRGVFCCEKRLTFSWYGACYDIFPVVSYEVFLIYG